MFIFHILFFILILIKIIIIIYLKLKIKMEDLLPLLFDVSKKY